MIPGVKLIDDILKGLPENARLREQLEELRSQIAILQTENEHLKEQAAQFTVKNDIIENLPADALRILGLLASSPGRGNTKKLGNAAGVEVGKLHLYLEQLYKVGFVGPVVNTGDARIVEITPEGRAFHYGKNT
jgi:DNA-binding MarR family transcriptional regulator